MCAPPPPGVNGQGHRLPPRYDRSADERAQLDTDQTSIGHSSKADGRTETVSPSAPRGGSPSTSRMTTEPPMRTTTASPSMSSIRPLSAWPCSLSPCRATILGPSAHTSDPTASTSTCCVLPTVGASSPRQCATTGPRSVSHPTVAGRSPVTVRTVTSTSPIVPHERTHLAAIRSTESADERTRSLRQLHWSAELSPAPGMRALVACLTVPIRRCLLQCVPCRPRPKPMICSSRQQRSVRDS